MRIEVVVKTSVESEKVVDAIIEALEFHSIPTPVIIVHQD